MKSKNLFKYFIFCFYIIILIDVLFLEREADLEVGFNIVPFYSLRLFIPLLNSNCQPYRFLAFINIFGNIIIFIPFGILLPIIFNKQDNIFIVVVTAFLISLIVEIIQFITKLGTADIDDVLLNVFGAAIGYLMFKTIRRLRK